jgi:hypothetical protein
MRKVATVALMASMFTLSLATPSPALADAYDDCVDVCIQNYMVQTSDPQRYELCRSSCERKYPPGFAAPSMVAKLD